MSNHKHKLKEINLPPMHHIRYHAVGKLMQTTDLFFFLNYCGACSYILCLRYLTYIHQKVCNCKLSFLHRTDKVCRNRMRAVWVGRIRSVTLTINPLCWYFCSYRTKSEWFCLKHDFSNKMNEFLTKKKPNPPPSKKKKQEVPGLHICWILLFIL